MQLQLATLRFADVGGTGAVAAAAAVVVFDKGIYCAISCLMRLQIRRSYPAVHLPHGARLNVAVLAQRPVLAGRHGLHLGVVQVVVPCIESKLASGQPCGPS